MANFGGPRLSTSTRTSPVNTPSLSSSQASSQAIVPESNHRQDVPDFVRWAIAQLGIDFQIEEGSPGQRVGRIRLAEKDQPDFDGQTELRVALDDSASDPQLEAISLESRFGKWLIRELQAGGMAVFARPSEQPKAVKDIAASLFTAYQVDGGRVHLGGCQLTDYPFLRLSFVAAENGSPCIRHVFVAPDGASVPNNLARDLGLMHLTPIRDLPPRIDDSALSALITAGRRLAAKSSSTRDPSATTVEPVATTLVWVKHADGHLQFTIGEASATLAFSGWAKLLKPQPFSCEFSGVSTFHLAATDDGKIDAWDQIATCQQSGRRVLKQELVECSVTARQVLDEFTEVCPVSGKPAIREEFCTCQICRQRVSKAVIGERGCAACVGLTAIKKDDPRLVWILGEHPGLDRWNRWQLSETEHVYIALALGMLKRLLVVVDKETLAVRHLATSGRLASSWTPVEGNSQAEFLH